MLWDRRFIFAGLGDRMVSIDQSRALWRHWGEPRAAWYHGGHLSFQREPEVQALLREAFAKAGLVSERRPSVYAPAA